MNNINTDIHYKLHYNLNTTLFYTINYIQVQAQQSTYYITNLKQNTFVQNYPGN